MIQLLRLLFLILATLTMTACGEVQLNLQLNEDGSVSFVEELLMDQKTETILGRLAPPGPKDFWRQAKAYCDAHHFTLKTMTMNRLLISGSFPADRLGELRTMLDDQLVYFMAASGMKRLSDTPMLVRKVDASQEKYIVGKRISAEVEYDVSRDSLKRHFAPPAEFQDLFDLEELDTVRFRLNVKAPYTVATTNGEVDGKTVKWIVPFGKTGTLLYKVEPDNKSVLISGALLLLLALVGAGLLYAKHVRKRAIE